MQRAYYFLALGVVLSINEMSFWPMLSTLRSIGELFPVADALFYADGSFLWRV